MTSPTTTFAILAYDGVEPIDIGATYGVLSMARRLAPCLRFFVVSRAGGEIAMANGLRLIADHAFADCPDADILMVLGGPGWQAASEDAPTLAFIKKFHRQKKNTIAAVCTGGMILGATGLLAGRAATTKQEIVDGEIRPLDLLAQRYPDTRAIGARVVDTGSILTGGGVSLGIDMTLYLIRRFLGSEIADETARILEYRRAWKANAAELTDVVEVMDTASP